MDKTTTIELPLRTRTISNGTLIQCGDLVMPRTIAKVFARDPNGDEALPDAIIAAMIVTAVNAHAAHHELVALCTGILECLDQGDLWKKPARLHAAGLLRAALAKAHADG